MVRARVALNSGVADVVSVIDLGRLGYLAAYKRQVEAVERVLGGREREGSAPGEIFVVEHEPVVTVTRRKDAAGHVLATAEMLAAAGIERVETDRGGDVTYHGPGQIVCYPVLDLNRFGFRLHDYMRFLEESVIETLASFGVRGERDADATGVWVRDGSGELAKIAAMGVRVRRWVSFHGLALNVTTDLSHFGVIVPCGLVGRPVTSLERVLGGDSPPIEAVRAALARTMLDRLAGRLKR